VTGGMAAKEEEEEDAHMSVALVGETREEEADRASRALPCVALLVDR
jgi:hypothetical protein